MKIKMVLFITALVQVCFVAMNVVFITRAMIVPMVVTGFAISFIWTLNVKRIAIGSWADRITYATGAAIGTYLGFLSSHYLTHVL